MVSEAIVTKARYKYDEVLVDLRLTEGGGFKVGSQHRRALAAALQAVEGDIVADTLEMAAEAILGPSENLRDAATCRDIANELREKADEYGGG